jgi:hypothetical protein
LPPSKREESKKGRKKSKGPKKGKKEGISSDEGTKEGRQWEVYFNKLPQSLVVGSLP